LYRILAENFLTASYLAYQETGGRKQISVLKREIITLKTLCTRIRLCHVVGFYSEMVCEPGSQVSSQTVIQTASQ